MLKKWREYNESRRRKKNERSAAAIKNSKAIKEDRWAAIEYMKGLDEIEIAVPALLKRFDYSLENGITDVREKEMAYDGIVRYGNAALPFVQEHLRSSDHIAWPIKLLTQIGNEESLAESLKAALNFEDVAFDQAAVDKNYDVLCYLRDHQLPGFIGKIAHFLNDPDERVRFAAVEVLIEQKDPQVPRLVEHFIGDESSENRRIRQSVVEAFAQHGWKLANPEKLAPGLIVDGVVLTKDQTLEKRR